MWDRQTDVPADCSKVPSAVSGLITALLEAVGVTGVCTVAADIKPANKQGTCIKRKK
jgi:hypothetical protein